MPVLMQADRGADFTRFAEIGNAQSVSLGLLAVSRSNGIVHVQTGTNLADTVQ